jgi:hypothetical protein
MSRTLRALITTALLTFTIPAVAAAIPCQDAGDVSLLTAGCDSGLFHFDDFLVTVTGPAGVTAKVFLTDVVDTTLGFDVVTVPAIFSGALDVAFSYHVSDNPPDLAPVPEPSTLLLVSSTLAAIGYWRTRRTRAV